MKQAWKWLLFLFTLPLHADQFSFLFYNDVFAGTDKHFTNGVSISWLDNTFENRDENKSSRYSALTFDIADSVPFATIDRSRKHTAGISLSQMMITPSDTDLAGPQYDDIPYVGYLALSCYLFEWDDVSFEEYRMEAGVVGPQSGAGWLQKNIMVLSVLQSRRGGIRSLGPNGRSICFIGAVLKHGVTMTVAD